MHTHESDVLLVQLSGLTAQRPRSHLCLSDALVITRKGPVGQIGSGGLPTIPRLVKAKNLAIFIQGTEEDSVILCFLAPEFPQPHEYTRQNAARQLRMGEGQACCLLHLACSRQACYLLHLTCSRQRAWAYNRTWRASRVVIALDLPMQCEPQTL